MSIISDVLSNFRIYEMHQTIECLEKTGGFGFINLHLTETEQQVLREFIIKGSGDFGVFDLEDLSKKISVFLSSVGEGNTKAVADIIHRVALQVIQSSGKETAHIIVRTSLPTDAFNIPRWHIDGVYYEGSSLKFAAVLIGNPTLFYPLTVSKRTHFKEIQMQESKILQKAIEENGGEIPDNYFEITHNTRVECAEFLSKNPVISERGQGVFFNVSDMDRGAVHSEPIIASPRLFFSVLPGTEKEIQEYQTRLNR